MEQIVDFDRGFNGSEDNNERIGLDMDGLSL